MLLLHHAIIGIKDQLFISKTTKSSTNSRGEHHTLHVLPIFKKFIFYIRKLSSQNMHAYIWVVEENNFGLKNINPPPPPPSPTALRIWNPYSTSPNISPQLTYETLYSTTPNISPHLTYETLYRTPSNISPHRTYETLYSPPPNISPHLTYETLYSTHTQHLNVI